MDVVATPPDRANGRWTFARNGLSERANPNDGSQLRRVAKLLGVELEALRNAVTAATPVPPEPELEPTTSISAWNASEIPVDYPSLVEALQSGRQFVRWEGSGYCGVDVDIQKGSTQWTLPVLRKIVAGPTPTPDYAWPTRSGGLRLVFSRCDLLSARQRAGLWVLQRGDVTRRVGLDKVELVSVTRTPPGEWLRCGGGYGTADLERALRRTGGVATVGDDAVEQWLEARGMKMGGSYAHTQCPGAARPTGGNPPVKPYSGGVMCYVCSRLYPWGQLVTESGEPDPIVEMARTLVHWRHARLVVHAERPRCDPRFRRAGYEAMLIVLHPEPDERRKKAMRRVWSPDQRYVRSQGAWLRDDDFAMHHPFSRDAARLLPWTHGEPNRVDRAFCDAELPGYVPVEPVLHLCEEPRWFRDVVLVPQPVSGVPPDAEYTLAEAEDALREALPGVPAGWLASLQVLVHACLRAQLRLPQPPIVILTGASGAGKGALVAATAGIMGRPVAHLRFDGHRELAMSMGEGFERRAALLFGDEIGKTESWWHHSRAVLALGATHAWRKLHQGDVVSQVRAPVVLAGSTLPAGLATMPELARRACVIQLTGASIETTAEWGAGVRRYLGVGSLEDLRQSGVGAAVAECYVRAARDHVLSDALESSWTEHACALGAERLTDTEDMQALSHVVQALYRLWCTGPDETFLTDGNRRGWLRGWRTGVADDAAQVLTDWIDEEASRPERYARLQVLNTHALPGVTLRAVEHGRRIYVRFIAEHSKTLDRHDRKAFPWDETG